MAYYSILLNENPFDQNKGKDQGIDLLPNRNKVSISFHYLTKTVYPLTVLQGKATMEWQRIFGSVSKKS
jgi:hypothetical protein